MLTHCQKWNDSPSSLRKTFTASGLPSLDTCARKVIPSRERQQELFLENSRSKGIKILEILGGDEKRVFGVLSLYIGKYNYLKVERKVKVWR